MGHATSYVNLIGKRYGKLTVIGRHPEAPVWQCQCDCGNERRVSLGELNKGVVWSCGCVKRHRDNPATIKRRGVGIGSHAWSAESGVHLPRKMPHPRTATPR